MTYKTKLMNVLRLIHSENILIMRLLAESNQIGDRMHEEAGGPLNGMEEK